MSNNFKLVEVNGINTIRDFLNLPGYLYKNDNKYIRPLDTDIEKIFNPAKNKKFRNGDAIRWILKDQNNKTVGRLAAFYDHTPSKKKELEKKQRRMLFRNRNG